MRQELAELCGQVTIRYVQLAADCADEEPEVLQWLKSEYAQAEQLANSIIAYDDQVKQISVDEKKRADYALAYQIDTDRRARREAAMKRFRQEEAIKQQLLEQGTDPVQDTINALRDNTERIKELRAQHELG